MVQATWETTIRDRLFEAFAKRGGEIHLISMEFLMAGKTMDRSELIPTTVVTCEDAESRRRAIILMKDIPWLDHPRLSRFFPHRLPRHSSHRSSHRPPYRVVLESDLNVVEWYSRTSPSAPSDNYLIKANLDPEITVCGIQAAIASPCLDQPRLFRRGGLVVIQGEAYLITAGHIFQQAQSSGLPVRKEEAKNMHRRPPSSSVSLGSVTRRTSEDRGEEELNDLEHGDVDHSIPNAQQEEGPTIHISTVVDAWRNVGGPEVLQSVSLKSDWALIKWGSFRPWPANKVCIPGNPGFTTIETIFDSSQVAMGEVWAVTDSNQPVKGWLNANPTFLFLGGRRIRVQQATFEQALGEFCPFLLSVTHETRTWRLRCLDRPEWETLRTYCCWPYRPLLGLHGPYERHFRRHLKSLQCFPGEPGPGFSLDCYTWRIRRPRDKPAWCSLRSRFRQY
jgi:hypothetical protein